jgi:predicted phage tail protein
MTDKLRTVRLYGTLGSTFGREFNVVAGSAAQAVDALCHLLPGFKQFLATAHGRGLKFAVFYDRQNLTKEQLQDPPGNAVIRIAPVLTGSKRGGVLQTILGIILIVVGVYGNAAGGWGTPFIQAGIGMIVGGVAQMLAPSPKGQNAREDPGNQPSYAFSGPVNTQAQGHPVPVAYGQTWTGSAVISAGIFAEDQQ